MCYVVLGGISEAPSLIDECSAEIILRVVCLSANILLQSIKYTSL